LLGEQLRLVETLAEVNHWATECRNRLIACLSRRPKCADYPFTTLVPNLGVVRKPTGDGTVFADIPGLRCSSGLGWVTVLSHRGTRVLLHLIDATSDPIADYHTIQQELQAYGRGLAERPQILAFNKIDAVNLGDAIGVSTVSDSKQRPVFLISALPTGLDPLLQNLV